MNAAEQLIQRGLIRGRQEGRHEGHQESLLLILEERFTRVPEGLAEEIRSIQDAVKLRQLLSVALKCETLDAFAAEL